MGSIYNGGSGGIGGYSFSGTPNSSNYSFKIEMIKERPPKIKNVIFNNPYTIVFWTDGTKTTVTCGEGDVWDEEKGIALAFVKKLYGNKGSYIENIKPFLSENVEKEKARLAEEKKRLDDEAKAEEEKRKQRHIKNLAKKRLRKEKLEHEVKVTVSKLKRKENVSIADAWLRGANSAAQCASSFDNTVGYLANSYNSGDTHIHCDTKNDDVLDSLVKQLKELERPTNANS